MSADGFVGCGLFSAQAASNPLPVVRAVSFSEPRCWRALLMFWRKHTCVVVCSEDQGDALALVVAGCNTLFECRSPNTPAPKAFATLLRLVGRVTTGSIFFPIRFICVGTPDYNGNASAGAACMDQVLIDPVCFFAGLVEEVVKTLWRFLSCSLVLKFYIVVDPGCFIVSTVFANMFNCFKAKGKSRFLNLFIGFGLVAPMIFCLDDTAEEAAPCSSNVFFLPPTLECVFNVLRISRVGNQTRAEVWVWLIPLFGWWRDLDLRLLRLLLLLVCSAGFGGGFGGLLPPGGCAKSFARSFSHLACIGRVLLSGGTPLLLGSA